MQTCWNICTLNAVGDCWNTPFTSISRCCIQIKSLSAFGALTWSALRAIVVRNWTKLTCGSCWVKFKSRETTETFHRFVANFTILYATFALKISCVKVISNITTCAISCYNRTSRTWIGAFWTGVTYCQKHSFFTVVTDSCLITRNTVWIRTSYAGTCWCPISYFTLGTVIACLTNKTISWTLNTLFCCWILIKT